MLRVLPSHWPSLAVFARRSGLTTAVEERTIRNDEYEFFKRNGFLTLGKLLSDDDVKRFVAAFDRNRRDFGGFWSGNGIWQSVHCHQLLTAPEFDEIIRHPAVLNCLNGLFGGAVCFSEISLRHMGPYNGEPLSGMTSWDGSVGQRWHRDGGGRFIWPEHELRLGYVQLMVYLTDVSEETHSFAISPETADEELLESEEQLDRGGARDLYGGAGTAILFDATSLHTVTLRPTQSERKSVQIYYGHRHRDHLSEMSYTPTQFWRDHPDAEVREFYGVLNRKTRQYLQQTEGRDEVPLEETLNILADITF
jgi:hypothetical protein